MTVLELNIVEKTEVQIRMGNEFFVLKGFITELGELVIPAGTETFILSPIEFRRDHSINRCFIKDEKNKKKILGK